MASSRQTRAPISRRSGLGCSFFRRLVLAEEVLLRLEEDLPVLLPDRLEVLFPDRLEVLLPDRLAELLPERLEVPLRLAPPDRVVLDFDVDIILHSFLSKCSEVNAAAQSTALRIRATRPAPQQ